MAVQNSLTQNKTNQRFGISAYLSQDAVKDQINRVVGGKDAQRFITSIVSAVNANPKLQECSNGSILAAALIGQALKLSPSPQLGQFYMVPYNDKKKGIATAQFQMGWRGYFQLAIRSGAYSKLNAITVKEGELIKFDPFTEEIEVKAIENPEERENAKTIGYYAFYETTWGFKKAMYWSKEKMLRHADRYSQAFSIKATQGKYPKVSYADYEAGKYDKRDEWLYSSFWYKDFDAMALKTMYRQLIGKYGAMSIDSDFAKAMETDYAVANGVNTDGTPDYVQTEEYAEEPEIVEAVAEEVAPAKANDDVQVVPENLFS